MNPNHLELGTHVENASDRIRDETIARGERHGRTKLTGDQVQAIRTRTEIQRVLATEYGVSRETISKIKTEKSWRWLHSGET